MRISKLIIAFTAILLTVNATAQTKDISLLAGVNIPLYKGTGTDAMPAFHYNLTDNYVRHSTLYDTMAGSQKEDVTPLRWNQRVIP